MATCSLRKAGATARSGWAGVRGCRAGPPPYFHCSGENVPPAAPERSCAPGDKQGTHLLLPPARACPKTCSPTPAHGPDPRPRPAAQALNSQRTGSL